MAYPISDVTRRVVYSGSAGVGPYGFTFEILTSSDIAVYKNDNLLSSGTGYTVTINTNGTGSITLASAASSTDVITIVGDRSIQRSTDFVTGGDLFANSLNDELDSLVIFDQQTNERLNRTMIAPVTDPLTINMALPSAEDRAEKYLGFDGDGNPIVSDIIPDSRYYGASADDPTTRPNGAAMVAGDAYYNTTYSQLRIYSGSAWSTAPYVAEGTSFRNASATSGQTEYTVTGGYTPGKIQVYVNGVLMAPSDYTATNGTSITFASALAASDVIDVTIYKSVGTVSINDVTGITISTSAPSGSAAEGAIWFKV